MKNNNIQNIRRDIKKDIKKRKYVDKKQKKNKKQNRDVEKIEKLVKNKNPSRTSLMERGSKCNYKFNYMNLEYLDFLKSQVRLGGKGSMRRKKKICLSCLKGELVKKNVKINKKQIKISAPIHYEKDDCCVCYERVKMSKENTIDCNGKTRTLCLDCKGKMKKDICPLCNNHSIGLRIMNYNFIRIPRVYNYEEPRSYLFGRVNRFRYTEIYESLGFMIRNDLNNRDSDDWFLNYALDYDIN